MIGWFALALVVAVVLATAAIFASGRKADTQLNYTPLKAMA